MTRLDAFLVSVALSGPCCPAQAVWTQLNPGNAPSHRDAVRLAFDPVRQEVLLFGGNGHSPQNDTWVFDGTVWTQLAPAVSPPVRSWHSMASDSARLRVVMFGGSDALGVTNETWEWDGATWAQAIPASSPSARSFTAMAHDALRGEIVLFGGFPGSTPLADTWTWDGVNWTQRAPATTPAARGWHAMAFDEKNGEVVMFGGFAGGASPTFGDTWVFDGTDWTQRQPATAPNGQLGHGMVYDGARQRVVMSPGFERPLMAQGTWEWDGQDWQLATSGAGPIGNWDNGLAYDRTNERVVHFGGRLGGTGCSDQTWEYASVNPAQFAPFGSGCAGTAGMPVLRADCRPWIGDTMSASVAPVPAGQLTLFVFGLSDTSWAGRPLPTSLAPEGMPGCTGYVSADAAIVVANAGAAASWSAPVGTDPGLVGARFFVQCVVLDAGVSTAFPAVVSNALGAVVGLR